LRRSIAMRLRKAATLEINPKARAAAFALAKADPVFFICEFVWTEDPRLIAQDLPAMVPFELFGYQDDFIRWLKGRLDAREPGLVEKSRDMGFTWLAAAFAVWVWLFYPGAAIGFGSRKQDLVDKKGDPKSIFHRIRFIIDHLPPWLRPKGYDRRTHDNFMLVVNPETGSTIAGEAGDNIGRGGRTLIYFADEFAYLERPELVDAALSQNTDVVIYGSSANGMGSLFYKKRIGGAIPVFTMRWDMDPRKSPEWREQMLRRYGPLIVAQEIDIDYGASVDGVVVKAAWVQSAMALHEKLRAEGMLDELARRDRTAGLDVADGGGDESVLTVRCGPLVLAQHSRGEGNTTQTARWAASKVAEIGNVEELFFDAIGVGAGIGGELWSLQSEGAIKFSHHAVNVGSSPSNVRWFATEDSPGRPAREVFANLKAELHWMMRERFERTHEHVTGQAIHDIEDMIAIPPDAQKLIAQLPVVLYELDAKGRIRIESKDALKRRLGADASPDHAESLMLTFAGSTSTSAPLIGRA
jgi:phage terminase large subunit